LHRKIRLRYLFAKFPYFFKFFALLLHTLSYHAAYLHDSLAQDPSIQQVAQNTANNNQNLDDYDPFSSTTTTKSTAPPTLQANNQSLPAYSASGQQYQVNDNPNVVSSSGGGVTQISTAELQVSHQFFLFNAHKLVLLEFHYCWQDLLIIILKSSPLSVRLQLKELRVRLKEK
jgi:hypothetical protein